MAKRTRVEASVRRTGARHSADAQSIGYKAVCPALIVLAAPTVADDARALAVATRAVTEVLGRGFALEPLGAGARDYRITRASGEAFEPGEAWTLTRALIAHRDIADAEPVLEQPGLEPPAVEVVEGPRLRPRDTSGDAPLPCAETHPEWSLELCRVKDAWQLVPPTPEGRIHGEGIRVGHPDTGYTRHAEIWDDQPRVLAAEGFDFVRRSADPLDPLERGNPGHGTTTASVIMSGIGGADARKFVSGVAPRASLVPFRVTPSVVLLSFDRLAEAIRLAADRDCHVISMSLGGPVPSRALERAIAYAVHRGVIVLAAAGNVWPWVVYPARLDQVIACAACNCQRAIWRNSASGDTVDVTAPGESVWVARPGSTAGPADDLVNHGSGTSYAVATVAGACALWLAFHGRDALIARYGADQLAAVFKDLLMAQGVTTPPGWKKDRHGAGILDVASLLSAALPDTPPAIGLRVRAAAAPRRPHDLDRILPYFPDTAPQHVRRGLVRLLGTSEDQLPARLDELGDELVFHIATNPDVRARVLAPAAPKKRGSDVRARAAGPARARSQDRLDREASPALQQLLRP
jgi:serine protease